MTDPVHEEKEGANYNFLPSHSIATYTNSHLSLPSQLA